MKALLLAALLAGCSAAPLTVSEPVAPPASPTAADVAIAQLEVVQYMFEGTPVYAELVWLPCGFENAFYALPSGPIVVCLELDPNAAVFAAAHEAGHALVIQLGMDPGDDAVAGERAADELAALFLIERGQEDAVVGGAQWFMKDLYAPGDGVHPTNADRAWRLLCLVDGSTSKGTAECQSLYFFTWVRWKHQLAQALAKAASNG